MPRCRTSPNRHVAKRQILGRRVRSLVVGQLHLTKWYPKSRKQRTESARIRGLVALLGPEPPHSSRRSHPLRSGEENRAQCRQPQLLFRWPNGPGSKCRRTISVACRRDWIRNSWPAHGQQAAHRELRSKLCPESLRRLYWSRETSPVTQELAPASQA